jgi:hypothetical protein
MPNKSLCRIKVELVDSFVSFPAYGSVMYSIPVKHDFASTSQYH